LQRLTFLAKVLRDTGDTRNGLTGFVFDGCHMFVCLFVLWKESMLPRA
jgi:hypothetical protein